MKKNNIFIITSYGLFLGWLLSFLYNGPALDIVFKNSSTSKYLAIAYILTPSIILFCVGIFNINEKYKSKFMIYSVLFSIIGTVLSFLANKLGNDILTYILVGMMGIFSVVFIAGWSCYFVESIKYEVMYKCMAYVICLGYIIFNFNKLLKYYELNNLILITLFLCLIGSLYSASKLIKTHIKKKTDFKIDFEVKLLVIVCFLMFLLNVGGGVVQAIIDPIAQNQFGNINLFNVCLYIIIGLLISKSKLKIPTDIVLTASMVIIACGYLMFIIFVNNLIIPYIFIILGYAVADIFLWTLVAQMGYIYGKTIKIFIFVMASNLLAVFTGNLIGVLLQNGNEKIYISITISALTIIIAFILMPFMNNLIKKGQDKVMQAMKTREHLNGIITDEKINELLTDKELEIYKFMLLGITNKEIAEKANISYNTLKGHARNIYSKLKVRNKKELIENLSKEDLC